MNSAHVDVAAKAGYSESLVQHPLYVDDSTNANAAAFVNSITSVHFRLSFRRSSACLIIMARSSNS